MELRNPCSQNCPYFIPEIEIQAGVSNISLARYHESVRFICLFFARNVTQFRTKCI